MPSFFIQNSSYLRGKRLQDIKKKERQSLEVDSALDKGFYNDQTAGIDDEIFITLIRSGIEEAANNDKSLFDELMDHALKLYVDAWLADAETDEDADLAQEKRDATETFTKHLKEESVLVNAVPVRSTEKELNITCHQV